MNKALACLFTVTALLGTAPGPATAQDPSYPTRPVKIIVAFPVGGLIDTVSRIVGDKLSAVLGQQFIIEADPAPAERWRPPRSHAPSPTATR